MKDKFSDIDVWDHCPVCNEKVGNGEAYTHCKKDTVSKEELKEAMKKIMEEMEEKFGNHD